MKIIVANFKMNLLDEEIDNYIKKIKLNNMDNVIFCPTSIYLKDFIRNGLQTGCQNIGFEEKGAYTGEVSLLQIKSIGTKYALIGHSERRKFFNDNNYINSKLKLCLNNDIIPIVCIGEEENEKNIKDQVLSKQIDVAFSSCNPISLTNCLIAYEPIWSIGTGLIPTNLEIFNTIKFIKDYIQEKYSFTIKVLYGGSINNQNIDLLEQIEILDGYLVGGTSLNANLFLELISKIK